MKSGRTQVEIIALYEELGSYRAVGALLGCDHKTVKRYVRAAGEAGQLAPALSRSRVTDDFAGLIAERVEPGGDELVLAPVGLGTRSRPVAQCPRAAVRSR